MSNNEKNKSDLYKLYLPRCPECDGILYIIINPFNFSINYICEKNNNHKKYHIYFKTFERFYLKEKILISCSKCHLNLENSQSFNCGICKKYYCCNCFIDDIQVNGHKNLIKNQINNRCLIHNNDFTEYCFNCKKNICIICARNCQYNNHIIKYFIDIMPSLQNIEKVKIKYNEKKIYLNSLIVKINLWQKEINKKIEELKQNLQDEISLLDKIYNFNHDVRNYAYFQNFNVLQNFINIKSNIIIFYLNFIQSLVLRSKLIYYLKYLIIWVRKRI